MALAASTTTSYGVLFYAYAVLLIPMHSQLGWSRTFLAGTFSLSLIVAATATIPVGRWFDRHSPRPFFLAASLGSSLLMVVWASTSDHLVYVVVWTLIGACQAVLFYDSAFTVLAKAFAGQARDQAITAVTLSAGLASTIFAPLTAILQRLLGWRDAVLILAVMLAAVTLPSFTLGLRHVIATTPPEVRRSENASPREAFREIELWLLGIAYMFSTATTFAVAVILSPYLHSRNIGSTVAALVLGAIGVVQVLGRGTFVRLTRRRSSVKLASWVLAAKGAGVLILIVIPGSVGIALFVLAYGLANGLSTVTRPTTVAQIYGALHYGSIAAVVASMAAFGGALAPLAATACGAALGTEKPVFGALAVACLIAALANELARRQYEEGARRELRG